MDRKLAEIRAKVVIAQTTANRAKLEASDVARKAEQIVASIAAEYSAKVDAVSHSLPSTRATESFQPAKRSRSCPPSSVGFALVFFSVMRWKRTWNTTT